MKAIYNGIPILLFFFINTVPIIVNEINCILSKNIVYQFTLIVVLYNNFKIIKNSNEVYVNKTFIKNMYIAFLIYSFFENILFNISSLFAILIYTFINIMNIKEER